MTPVGSPVTNSCAAASSIACTKTGVTQGNSLIAILSAGQGSSAAYGPAVPTETIGGSAGGTFLNAGSQPFSSEVADAFELGCAIAYQSNCTAGDHVVTWPFPNGAVDYGEMTLIEVPGPITFDKSSAASQDNSSTPGSVQSQSTGTTPTLSQAAEFVVAALCVLSGAGKTNAAITDAPTGYTSLNVAQDTANGVGAEHCYMNTSTNSGVSASWSWTDNTSRASSALIATFIPAAPSGAALAGNAAASTTASAHLPAAAALAGGAVESATVAAALVSFAQVTLTAPLYTGIGSILDPNGSWTNGAPGVGSVVFYDPTFVTIDPDGEIVSTSNNCTALAQFNNGGTWSQLVIVITPGMVAYASVASMASGAFSTAASLVGAASALLSVVGTLTATIKLAGNVAAVNTAVGALSTAIKIAGTAIQVSSAGGSFSAGAAALAGAPVSLVSASAALSTAIQLTAAAVSVLSAAGNLATQISLSASALSASSASGSLGTGVTLGGAAVNASAASASILTQIRINAAANDLSQATGALTTQIALVGNAINSTVGKADMTIKNPLDGSAQAISLATGSLTALINMSGLAWASAAAQGALTTTVTLAPAAIANTLASGKLFTVPTITPPGSLADIRVVYAPSQGDPGYTQIGELPYGEFYQAAGEKIWYAINWNEWLANRWQSNTAVTIGQSIRPYPGNGYQQTCTIQGRTGSSVPAFEASSGAFVMDGSVEWVTTAVDDTSLGATVVSSNWSSSDDLALSGGGIRDQSTLVLIDTSGAIAGVDYDVQCTATMSDGQVNIGKIRIKVR